MKTLVELFHYLHAALATGGSVVAAQWLGHKEKEKASTCAMQLVLFVGVVSLAVMALMLIGRLEFFTVIVMLTKAFWKK